MNWFTADKKGLRQVNERLVERRGFGIIGAELYQNVMDTDATVCEITVNKVPGKPRILIECFDDGPGFADLTHAWTMFAPSLKKGDPTKAGRFNVGEKVVLSFAHSASIHTTTGKVVFDENGRKEYPRQKRDHGTLFVAELAAKQEYLEQLIEHMRRIIVRPGLELIVNNEIIPHRRKTLGKFEHRLPTEIGDDLRRTLRNTEIQIFEPPSGKTPMLFELGIPVVETGDKWDVSIQQKVPLNTDRDNVTPAFLRQVRVAVFNHMHSLIEEEDTTSSWVNEAASDPNCETEAATTFLHKKFGEDVVTADPTNMEANNEAVSQGWAVIPPRGALTPGQRANLKEAGLLVSSSTQFPNYKNAKSCSGEPAKKTPGMSRIEEYAKGLAQRLLNITIQVEFLESKKWTASADYGHKRLRFNVTKLGQGWFDRGVTETVAKLIIHELGHQLSDNHLSHDYHDGVCLLAARLQNAVLSEPGWFKQFID